MTTKVDGNSPAFPTAGFTSPNGDWCWPRDGISIRQLYAAAALQGFCANPEFHNRSEESLSSMAFFQADAMITHENRE